MKPALHPGVWMAAVVVTAAASAPGARAQTFLTQEEALELAFPAADSVVRRTAFLGDEQLARARAEAGRGVEIPSGIVTHYVAMRGGRPVGVAYFDAHRVRTLPEALMIVVGPDDRIRRVEVLKFSEPPEYVAPAGWLAQFEGKALDRDLSLKGGVINITGATLTSGAVTAAARRVLALHALVRPFSPSP